MAFTRSIRQETGSDDADLWQTNTFNNNRTYVNVGTHAVNSWGYWTGFRFPVPADINPADITNVVLKLNCNASGSINTMIRVEQGNAQSWANNTTDSPKERWQNLGATGEVNWAASVTTGNYYSSPNISAKVKTALASLGSGDYLGIICGANPANSVMSIAQMMSADYTVDTNKRPELIITYDPPPQDANVTTIAPSMGTTTNAPVLYKKTSNIDYHDGIGDSTRRIMDIYTPLGTPPTNGWAVTFFIHGGGFGAGSKDDISGVIRLVNDTIGSGFAIVSISYKLTKGDIVFNTNTGYTNPSAVQDAFCALKFVETNKSTYSLNTDILISTSYSAGGNISLMLALLIEDANRDTYQAIYRGANTTLGTRYPDYPALAYSEGRTGLPSFKGLYSMAGAVNLGDVYNLNIVIRPVLSLYFGRKPNDSYLVIGGEGNVDDYMEGKAGTIYASKPAAAPKFPIAWTYSTNDTTVPEAAGYTALYDALNTVGYDVSKANNNNGTINSGVTLSKHSYYDGYFNGGGHDGVFIMYSSAFYTDFLNEARRQAETNNTTDFFPFF